MCEQLFTFNVATFVLVVIVVIGLFIDSIVDTIVKGKKDKPS